ncbi:MAG: DNA alkylation repair protein [Candidatus Stygibacter australis]|nr:DNA alkylation repair protein [Candidatus Stygibacter australis]MDP8322243.1 DNA alkylation repair protein [Candidatus Stygibacter australis]
MFNKIGRLDNEDTKNLKELVNKLFALLAEGKTVKVEKEIYKVANTPNYFIREHLGTYLAKNVDADKMEPLMKKMLDHKFYGIRATAVFYYFHLCQDEPEEILNILDSCYKSTPWEAESIVNEMWRKYPDLMKERMTQWIKSEDENKRALSFHGMENISNSDPNFIMEFISNAIDDDKIEVQKKITHILTQVARSNPIIVFPYIREWLVEADDTRVKTIWVSMKKLANIIVQRNRNEQSQEFVLLTQQTIEDWKNDENEKVSYMGEKLFRIIRR